MGAAKKKEKDCNLVIAGLFSRKDAAQYISNGNAHVHSSTLSSQDPLVETTQKILENKTSAIFTWEKGQPISKIWVSSSSFRSEVIQNIIREISPNHKRELREKAGLLLEELLTNALYHSYKKEDGSDKYFRKDKVELGNNEKVCVEYFSKKEGLYLSVTDYGGTFNFQDLVKAFKRCYESEKNPVMENKDGGAGLGLYMIFEMTTHLRIDHILGQETKVSCWVSESKYFDPDYFSFNFFEWRK